MPILEASNASLIRSSRESQVMGLCLGRAIPEIGNRDLSFKLNDKLSKFVQDGARSGGGEAEKRGLCGAFVPCAA
jgi:hypothetical protein